jgi:transposase
MPLCTPFPGYLSVLVMDNARIHHGDEILELTQRFGNKLGIVDADAYNSSGVRVEYLLPYSPDLNPIEEAFLKIKAFIRRHASLLVSEGDGMLFDLMECMEVVTASDAVGYFIHGGYF